MFKKRLVAIEYGAYELVGKYSGQNGKVQLLHKGCGRIQEYYPKHFFEGQRCKGCTFTNVIWEKNYELIKQYKEETGSVYIPKRTLYKGMSLGEWCLQQRNSYRKGKLSAKQIEKLELLGFVWEVR